jgi:peptidoglycan hydrolase-like protein with peptidoglycan-binding domain
MSVSVVSRAQWGATDWKGKVYSVPMTERTEFFVHYHGDPPPTRLGKDVPRNVEKIHLANGWAGVGYNFMVDHNGTVYEGRGWNLVGAHCPNHNRSGIGVYVALGGAQEPSNAAKRAVAALYREACERAGRALYKRGHRDGKKTACPGEKLYAWVRAGMPVNGHSQGAETTDPSDRPILRRGSQGRHVEALQRDLLSAGYDLSVDGDFGPATESIVRDVQELSGLTVDGVVGPDTYRAIEALQPAPAPAPAPSKPKAQPKDRHLGLKTPLMRDQKGNHDVTNVQNALVKALLLRPDQVTGVYDRDTADAVNAFNRDNGITVAGCGPETWAELRKIVHGS